jgi:putative transposase
MSEPKHPWHHSPLHVFVPGMMYMVTASTLHKEHFFHGDSRLSILQEAIFDTLKSHGWKLQAWSVFSNHYHFIAKSPERESFLRQVIQRIHSLTAREVNRLENTSGRRIWFQYWDSCITYEKSYYPRLNYVHNNPVKHGLVPDAKLYLYCSASWFEGEADSLFRKKVESFRYDQIAVPDDY